jgi:hypothetical protein
MISDVYLLPANMYLGFPVYVLMPIVAATHVLYTIRNKRIAYCIPSLFF